MDTNYTTQRVFPGSEGYQEALRLIVLGRPDGGRIADSRVKDLVSFLESRPLELKVVVGAYQGDQMVSSAMVIESPGHAGLAYSACSPASERFPDATAAAMDCLRVESGREQISLLQALVAPHEMFLESIFERAGYTFLAELIYMDRSVSPVVEIQDTRVPDDLFFTSYSDSVRGMFLEALEQSYMGSLDCPGLNGLRKTEDVLEAHMAAGDFDPSCWWVVHRQGEIGGILLLSKVVGRSALEVVYMGVSPSMRGKGVGHALLSKAVTMCRKKRTSCLTLAVDSSNPPALKLYTQWGFKETMRRRAWISAL